jgi:MSHA pilin protein MshC
MVVKTAIPLFFRPSRGFTLLELVAVISIVAILAITATSMFNRLTFDTAAFGRELQSVLAFAQKAAVAERRTVTVNVAASTVSFTICSANPCGAQVGLPLPTRDGGSVLTAPSGVSIASSAASFAFTPSGGTDQAGPVTITVTGDGASVMTIEASTGYVHS